MSAKIAIAVRILFSVSMMVFGMNKFLGFIPNPPLEGTAGELLTIYRDSGFMYLIGGLEVLGGLGLLINRFLPLSLTVLVAIMFNAVIFHLLHDQSGLANAVMSLVFALLNVYFNRSRFTELLRV